MVVVLEEGLAVAGREIIRGSEADLMSKNCCGCCCCSCDLVIDWTLGWSGEEMDDDEEEDWGGKEEEEEEEVVNGVVEAARRLVDDDDDDDDNAIELLLLEMMNLGRDVLAVVGRYGEEEAKGMVERAERS